MLTKRTIWRASIIGVCGAVILVSVGVFLQRSRGSVQRVARPVATVTTTPQPTSALQWAMVDSPNQGAGDNFLAGIAAINANDIWTAGNYLDDASALHHTLVERWNGSAWVVMPTPAPGGGNSYLSSIAVIDGTDAWAVGEYQQGAGGADHTLIERWNGATWTVAPSPSPGGDIKFLFSIAAVNAHDIWAAGFYQDTATAFSRTLIEHWNGSAWAIVPSPNPGTGNNELYGVAALDANNAWVAGEYHDGSSGIVHTLIERWDGKQWSVVPSPNPGAGNNVLASVAVTDAQHAWVAGYYQTSAGEPSHTLVEQWNGASWSPVASLDPGYSDNELYSIAATDTQNVWSVGNYQDESGTLQSLIERWNGTRWSLEPSPDPGTAANSLDGVAVTDATHAWAVGEFHGNDAFKTLFVQGHAANP